MNKTNLLLGTLSFLKMGALALCAYELGSSPMNSCLYLCGFIAALGYQMKVEKRVESQYQAYSRAVTEEQVVLRGIRAAVQRGETISEDSITQSIEATTKANSLSFGLFKTKHVNVAFLKTASQ